MKQRGRIGLFSFVIGSISIPIAASAVYVRSIAGAGSSLLLDWLVSKGITFSNPNAMPALSAPGLFTVTDTTAINFVTSFSIVLAIVAIAAALVAEYFREHTLYLSAGYICGAMAILLVRPVFGLAALIAGIALAMVLRHRNGASNI